MNNAIFISWESHQRTRRLCEKLDIPLYEIVIKRNPVVRYALSTKRTIEIILKLRPRKLIIQNPSIVLALLCLIIRAVFRFKLVVDAHNEAVTPYIHSGGVIRVISKILIKLSDYTIVTNQNLGEKISKLGGTPLVVPDFLPNKLPMTIQNSPVEKECIVTFICTYAPDEPYEEVFKAATLLGSKVSIFVTGRIPAHLRSQEMPENLHLLGFLSEEKYWDQLYNSHLVIDLTTMPDCLVCGAYESLSIAKPMILSESDTARTLFWSAKQTNNNAEAIKNAIEESIKSYSDQIEKTHKNRDIKLEQEKITEQELMEVLSND